MQKMCGKVHSLSLSFSKCENISHFSMDIALNTINQKMNRFLNVISCIRNPKSFINSPNEPTLYNGSSLFSYSYSIVSSTSLSTPTASSPDPGLEDDTLVFVEDAFDDFEDDFLRFLCSLNTRNTP